MLGEEGFNAGDIAAGGAKLARFLELAGLLLHAEVKLLLLDLPAPGLEFLDGILPEFFNFHGLKA